MLRRFEVRTIQNRTFFILGVLFLAVVALIVRLFFLQIVEGSKYAEKSQQQIEESRKLQSPRGTIYDRHGRPLAVSAISKSLYADPHMLKAANISPSEIAQKLAPYVRLDEASLVEKLSEDTAFVWIDRMMDKEMSDAVAKILKEDKIEGLNFVPESRRFYPNGELAAQVLGFVGIDDKGLDGLEMVMDDEIKGAITKELVATDRHGNPIFGSVLSRFRPEKEKSVTLTIDATIKFIAERALNKAMTETKAAGASIIIMDPKTGEILAMANRPTYDPNRFSEGREEDFTNRSVVNLYEPGSTFKPIVAASALDSGKWAIDEVYHDQGSITVSGETIQNWDREANGDVRLIDILKYSINTGMAYIGLKVGPEQLTEYAKRFGFGKQTDIELPGEGEGILFNPSEMRGIDTASMSIGQGIAVTPLQMVQAFGAIANNGKMVRPHIIRSVNSPDGTVERATETKEVGQPISAETAKIIVDILEKEISEGGGGRAMVEGYKFGGKTGTAQKLDTKHGGYLEGRYIASFVGFGPVEDAKFVALIVIDDPSGVYYGGQIAAPVFRDIMTQLVRYYQLSPSVTKEYEDAKKERPSIPEVTKDETGKIILPDFTGWTLGEVRQWLNEAGLVFKPVGTGYAITQEERSGTALEQGKSVTVHFQR